MSAAATLTSIPAEVEKIAAESGLSTTDTSALMSAFVPHFTKTAEALREATTIQADQPKAARACRLDLRAARTDADKTREALKADSLKRSGFIQAIFNALKAQVEPVEARLVEIEKAEEIAEAKRKADVQAKRFTELSQFIDPQHYDLGNMPDLQWASLLSMSKDAHAKRIADEQAARVKAEAEAKAAAEAKAKRDAEEAAERDRLRAENERLAKAAKDAEEKAAADRAQAQKEREAVEAKARAERAEADRLAKIAQAEADHAARLERERREEVEAKLRRQNEAEAKRVAEQRAAAERAAAAPDREKVLAFGAALIALDVPSLSSTKGAELAGRIRQQVVKFAAWLEAESAKL